MTKWTVVTGVAAIVMALGVPQARAQESKAFASVEFGAPPMRHHVDSSSSFPLYDETATVTTSQSIRSGPIVGGFGGFRLTPSFGVAAGFTYFHAGASDGAVTASVPDPFFFNRPRTVNATATGLGHHELGIHFQAVWFAPVNDKWEVVLAGGPSLMNVSHDSATVSVSGSTVTTGTVSESKTAFGLNAGIEVNYRLNAQYLIGPFVRYAGGKVDLPSAPDLRVGGLQTGVGLRIRF